MIATIDSATMSPQQNQHGYDSAIDSATTGWLVLEIRYGTGRTGTADNRREPPATDSQIGAQVNSKGPTAVGFQEFTFFQFRWRSTGLCGRLLLALDLVRRGFER